MSRIEEAFRGLRFEDWWLRLQKYQYYATISASIVIYLDNSNPVNTVKSSRLYHRVIISGIGITMFVMSPVVPVFWVIPGSVRDWMTLAIITIPADNYIINIGREEKITSLLKHSSTSILTEAKSTMINIHKQDWGQYSGHGIIMRVLVVLVFTVKIWRLEHFI